MPRFLRAGVFGEGWRLAVLSILLAVAVYLFNDVYDLLNHGPARLFLRTPLDQAIPTVPVFAIPYVSLDAYVYFTLVALLLLRQRTFQSAAVAMLLAWAVSYLVYWTAQSYVARPALTGGDFLTGLIRGVYASDRPYNDFPSLHVSISTVMAVHWWRFDRRAGWVAAAWTALIVPSTLFVHQHYVADVAGGLLVATGACWLAPRVAAGLRGLAGGRRPGGGMSPAPTAAS